MTTPFIELYSEVLRLALGGLAVTSAIHKLSARRRTQDAASALIGLGPDVGRVGWAMAIGVELGGGAVMLLNRDPVIGAALLGGLWLAYAGALVRNAKFGSVEDCGCSFGARHVPPVFAVTRNLGLAALAALFAVAGGASDVALLFSLPAALVLLTLYLAAEAIASNTASSRSRA